MRPDPRAIELVTRIWFPSPELKGWADGHIPPNLDFYFTKHGARVSGRLNIFSSYCVRSGDSGMAWIDIPELLTPRYALPEVGDQFDVYLGRPSNFLPSSGVIGHGVVEHASDSPRYYYAPDAKVYIECKNECEAVAFECGLMIDLSFHGDMRSIYGHFGGVERLSDTRLAALLCIHEHPAHTDSIDWNTGRSDFQDWLLKQRKFDASRRDKTIGWGEVVTVELSDADRKKLQRPRRA